MRQSIVNRAWEAIIRTKEQKRTLHRKNHREKRPHPRLVCPKKRDLHKKAFVNIEIRRRKNRQKNETKYQKHHIHKLILPPFFKGLVNLDGIYSKNSYKIFAKFGYFLNHFINFQAH